MAEFQPSHGNENLKTSMGEIQNEITSKGTLIEGSIKRYILNTTTLIDGEKLRRETFGEKDERKPHKTILLLGETGVGKSTVINAMVNYLLDVQWKNNIWCEIIETKTDQEDSQTLAVTVYDVFTHNSPISMTIIDTPGFGHTEGIEKDLEVPEYLLELFRSNDGVLEIDAVCLVVTSHTLRLTDRQLYVFDAVLSLFGCDVDKNIVVFITHVSSPPTNAIKVIKKSVKCAKDDNGELINFQFNNSHCEDFNAEKVCDQFKESWDLLNKSMKDFLVFLNENKPVNLKLTVSVLRKRKQLTASISNLKDRINQAELKQKELQQTKEALDQFEKEKKDMNNFEFEVDEPYKEKVPIESKWWDFRSKEATCCSVCEENCHYPGCWWVSDLSWCSVMSEGKCTVCTGRCVYTQHVKEGKMYVLKTRRVKKTMNDLKMKYELQVREKESLMSKIQNELDKQKTEQSRLVDESYQCVVILDEIALNIDAVSVFQHLDFLIEKVKDTGNMERVQKLEELKHRSEVKNKGMLGYVSQLRFHFP